MQSLSRIKAAIEQELVNIGEYCHDRFGDDSRILLSHEEERLKRLLACTEQYICEQKELEHHIEMYV